LHRLAREMNKGVLVSTHELDLALQVADEVWLLQSAGPPHRGVPEDLVLGGIFEAAFAKEDVSFDRATGVFRIHPEGVRPIGLAEKGITAFWTRRALQREGYTVVSGQAVMAVDNIEIDEEQGRPVWVLRTRAGTRRLGSIAELLQALGDPHLP
ncbi:MAG TPA: hypothetical protein VKQ52_11805, partial [Puia sp.]|nr:hypothetical protein [Puia sp.]